MAKIISGMVGTDGSPADGSGFSSAQVPGAPTWTVVVTYNNPFAASSSPPVGFASVSGTLDDLGVTFALQSSNTSLAIYTDSDKPVPIMFLATDRGLG